MRSPAKLNWTDNYSIVRRVRTALLLALNALLAASIVRLHLAFWREAGTGERAAAPAPGEEATAPGAPEAEAPFVAVVSCIKAGEYHQGAHYLERSLLPSLRETITAEEWASYRLELILGYDHDDEYWRGHSRQVLENDGGYDPPADGRRIPINFVAIRKDPGGDRPHRIPFNELCRAAYDYGATYIVRINDDTEFLTPGWITVATAGLRSFSPPGVGVVAPSCRQGAAGGPREIMTHDFVHAPSHYAIFDEYYPEEFDNYYVDDWISKVYGAKRTRTLRKWEVKHHLSAMRYEPTFRQNELLDGLVAEGRERVEKIFPTETLWKRLFLRNKSLDTDAIIGERETRRDERRVLGTAAIEHVDGPMHEVHLSFMRNPPATHR